MKDETLENDETGPNDTAEHDKSYLDIIYSKEHKHQFLDFFIGFVLGFLRFSF